MRFCHLAASDWWDLSFYFGLAFITKWATVNNVRPSERYAVLLPMSVDQTYHSINSSKISLCSISRWISFINRLWLVNCMPCYHICGPLLPNGTSHQAQVTYFTFSSGRNLYFVTIPWINTFNLSGTCYIGLHDFRFFASRLVSTK